MTAREVCAGEKRLIERTIEYVRKGGLETWKINPDIISPAGDGGASGVSSARLPLSIRSGSFRTLNISQHLLFENIIIVNDRTNKYSRNFIFCCDKR
jgi:hypothetical protein